MTGARRHTPVVILALLCAAGGCELTGRLPIGASLDRGVDGAADGRSRDGADGGAGEGQQDASYFRLHPLNIMQLNLGNLDELKQGPCPAYHEGTQCERNLELELSGHFFGKAGSWDIVVLNSVWDQDRCKGQNESDTKLVCHNYSSMIPYQQVRRLLGSDYTIICDSAGRFDCVGVRKGALASKSKLDADNCAPGALCFAAKALKVPAACATMKGIGGVSVVELTLKPASYYGSGEIPIRVVNVHAFAGAKDDATATACRLAQYKQVFELKELSANTHTLVAGDIGTDPRRGGCKYQDMAYWCSKVGHGKKYRYHAVGSVTRVSDQSAVDVVVSNFLGGSLCTVEEEKISPSFWHRLDHRPVRCHKIAFAIGGGPTCGDGTCDLPEDCLGCEKDCGTCP